MTFVRTRDCSGTEIRSHSGSDAVAPKFGAGLVLSLCLSERSVDMLDTFCGSDGSPPCMTRMTVVEELQGPKLSDSRANQQEPVVAAAPKFGATQDQMQWHRNSEPAMMLHILLASVVFSP